MANNKTKTDRIHDQMPRFFKTRVNPNWNALITALGESDQNLADLIEEVRKQFFVKTASRPYIDRLGANVQVSRPRLIGMDDNAFKSYIPVLAYQPKQVKLVLDSLLDIFFLKETTTAFTGAGATAPYALRDGWELEYLVDNLNTERIRFTDEEFEDISAAGADEVVASINRQAQHSFAVTYDDRATGETAIRIFSNTIGSKGSIEILGGRANMRFQFDGFIDDAGSGSNTEWTVTKVGDTVTFTNSGGVSPNLNAVSVDDVVMMSVSGNEGSFVVESVDLDAGSFTFTNLFATAGTYDHSALPSYQLVRFMTPEKRVVYTRDTRAVVWEVTPGEITVEMPATPAVVRRNLKGAAHLNGITQTVVDIPSTSSLELEDASEWPNSGQFILQPLNEIETHIYTGSEDTTIVKQQGSRFDKSKRYSYTSKVGNTISGISPALPSVSGVIERNITSIARTNSVDVTVVTSAAHGYSVGESVCVENVVGDTSLNGVYIITEITNSTTFKYKSPGTNGSYGAVGRSRVERIGIANSGSLVHLTTAQIDTGITGPYMWDSTAPYVISSLCSTIQEEIRAGNNVRSITLASDNNIPDEEGYVVFDFGTEFEEGPVRCLYKPNDTTLQLDPAYLFQKNHEIGSSITVIRQRGAHVMSGSADEYPAYISNPAVARETLQELLTKVKSVGIFIDFLVKYPEQLYSALDVYDSGSDNLWPIGEQ